MTQESFTKEEVIELLEELKSQSYLEQEPSGQDALKAQVVRVASINNILREKLGVK